MLEFVEKQELALFIALLRTRVPQFQKIIKDLFDVHMKDFLEVACATKERVESLIDSNKKELNDIVVEDLVDFVNEGKYKVVPIHEYVILKMLNAGLELAKYFFQMDWYILHVPSGYSLITTDSPFIILAPKDHEPPYPYGVSLIQPGSVKLIPLTKSTVLAMGDDGEKIEHRDFNDEQVVKHNEILALSSERLLIGSNEKLLSHIIERTKLLDRKRNEYVDSKSYGNSIQDFFRATTLNLSAHNATWLGSLID